MADKPVAPCFGISPATGKPVGERHRWPNSGRLRPGKWGKGACLYCGRTLEELKK